MLISHLSPWPFSGASSYTIAGWSDTIQNQDSRQPQRENIQTRPTLHIRLRIMIGPTASLKQRGATLLVVLLIAGLLANSAHSAPFPGRRGLLQAKQAVITDTDIDTGNIAAAEGKPAAIPKTAPPKEPKTSAKAAPLGKDQGAAGTGPSGSTSAILFTASGVGEQLAGNGTLATIFAPSDAALQSLASRLGLARAEDLLANASLAGVAANIIPLHVVPGAVVFSTNLTAGVPVEALSLAGTPLIIMKRGSGSISIYVGGHAALNGTAIDDDDDMEGRGDMGGMGMGDMAGMGMGDMGGMDGDGNDDDAGMRAQVISADIPFNGNVVHIINKVLLPPGSRLPERD